MVNLEVSQLYCKQNKLACWINSNYQRKKLEVSQHDKYPLELSQQQHFAVELSILSTFSH